MGITVSINLFLRFSTSHKLHKIAKAQSRTQNISKD
jgi:hypothetical protein